MTPRIRSLVLLFGALGLGFSGASAWVHYQLIANPSYSSFCDVNATFNCSQVYQSQYGSFQGVSTALLGIIWFGLTLLLAGFASPPSTASPQATTTVKAKAPASAVRVPASPAGSYLFAWATIGLAMVLYLAYASFFVLGTACLLCIGTYVCVVAIFILSGMSSSVPMGALPGRIGGDVKAITQNPAMLAVAVVFLGGVVGTLAFFPQDMGPQTPAEAAAQAKQAAVQTNQAAPPPADQQQAWLVEWDKAPREQTGVSADGAKIVVVKFNDFQCPSCRQGWVAYKPVMDEFEKAHPGALKYVIKDFPLEAECNFSSTMNHYASCESSAAMRMAAAAGKGDEMESWLFNNQMRLVGGVDVVQEGLKEITGLTNFSEQYAKMLVGIRQDVSDGVALRIGGTPTYFVNGVRLPPQLPPVYFKLALEQEWKKAGGQ